MMRLLLLRWPTLLVTAQALHEKEEISLSGFVRCSDHLKGGEHLSWGSAQLHLFACFLRVAFSCGYLIHLICHSLHAPFLTLCLGAATTHRCFIHLAFLRHHLHSLHLLPHRHCLQALQILIHPRRPRPRRHPQALLRCHLLRLHHHHLHLRPSL